MMRLSTSLALVLTTALLGSGCYWRKTDSSPASAPGEANHRHHDRATHQAAPPGPIRLTDVTDQTGIDFVHCHGGSGRRYIMETMSAGLALFDYDGDGLIDIYFLNGAPLPGTKTDTPPRNRLYRNLGGFRFVDVTEKAGVGDRGFGLGVAAADYDNDGDQDLYVNNFGPNVLYRNNGDGTFTDVTEQAGVANGNRVGAGVVFFDMDKDGDLDLYVANYVKFRYDRHVMRFVGGYPRYPGPRDYEPDPDTLYRNNGDGTFTDVSTESGIASRSGTGMGITSADYDNDGDGDLFICNDVRGNFLWRNDGTGHFDEAALLAGTAYNVYGAENASMGVDAADYDGDGKLDFFMTSYQGELPVLYRNLGNGRFEDVTVETGAGSGCFPHVNWGTGFADFDNDGDRDLFIACGHIQDLIDRIDSSTSYRARNILLMNDGRGKFVNVSHTAGSGMAVKMPSRGIGLDDLDNDGDVDVVILNLNDRPTILRNDSPAGNHWLQVLLRGVNTNRDGIGARVKVVAGELVLIDEVHSGRGYQSDHGRRLYFGLGKHEQVDRIEVHWVGGGTDLLGPLPANRLVTITEGQAPEH